jgi:Ca2+-binding EF-hand superfamily protein
MQRFTHAALICGLAFSTAAFAEHMGGFSAMDTNADGKISADEHAAGAKRMFDTMDADHDGKVTAAEMTAAHDKMGAKPAANEMSAADKIKTIDTNADGVLTADEHAAGSRSMFDRMDTDKDGFLTKAEFDAGHAKMMHKPQ